jgi:hypothetical protein
MSLRNGLRQERGSLIVANNAPASLYERGVWLCQNLVKQSPISALRTKRERLGLPLCPNQKV